jgi:hypothetical protein
MKTVIAALAIAISTTGASVAQDIDSLAQDYMELPAVQGMLSDMFSPETMGAQFVASLPTDMNLSDAQVSAVGQIMSEAMGDVRPEMETLMQQQSAEVFSAEELQAMIDFYSSDLGASILQKNTVFFTATMAELNPKIMAAVQRRQADIMQVLQGSE